VRSGRTLRVTHPFHPLSGRTFEFVIVRNIWGEQRAYYRDETGDLRSMPAAWTSEGPPDPFVTLAGGRSLFHIEDLLRLVALVGRISQ
jgi:hypothetical protein